MYREKELIQKIIDGEHTIEENDLITYPNLGYNIDVMEIAVSENPNFIKYAKYIYSSYEKSKSTIDIYEYALKKGYIPNVEDLEENPTLINQDCIMKVLEKEINDIIQKMENENYIISEEEVLHYNHIIKCFFRNYKEKFFQTILKQNHRFIKFFYVDSFNHNIDNKIIANIIEDGYIPLEEDLINGIQLGELYNIMDKAIEVNPNFIKYIRLKELESKNIELFEKALSRGYIPQEEDLKGNYYLRSSKLIMKKAIDMNVSYLKYTSVYDDELINLAIQKGYILTEEDIKNNPELLSSNILMKKAIDIDYKYILIFSKEVDNEVSADNIKYAISKGYLPKELEIIENDNWRKNNDIMMVLIKVNPNFVELSYDYETLFDFAVANGYRPTLTRIRDNENLLESSKLCNYLIKNDSMLYNNNFLNEYINRNDIKGLTLKIIDQIWSFINNNVAYESMNYNEMITIIKYVYVENLYDESNRYNRYRNLKERINELIQNQQFNIFNKIINILAENDNQDTKYKLNLMNDIINNFNKYYNLCCSFISSNYTKKDVYLLRHLLLSNNKLEHDIESIDDLKQYNELLFQNNKRKINDIPLEYDYATGEYDPSYFRDYILLMLFNMNYDEYMEKIHNGFSSKNIDILIKNINNNDIKEDLNRYKMVIKFIESILKVKDVKKLKVFAHRINEAIYKNSEATIDIYNILKNIENIKKYYYGIEIKEKLLDISKLEPTSKEILENEEEKEKQPYIRENKKYVCPNVEIHGKNLANETVDYIELNSIDFTLFVHVLNAFGIGGTLEDFKVPRLIGKTYICVSPITDNYYSGLAKSNDVKDHYTDEKLLLDISIENVDNVKLVFSNISPEQLVAMGNSDLCSWSADNSLDITTVREETYAPIRNNVESLNEKGYCEYVLYREDSNGRVVYPAAILSNEDEPSQAEIMAAAYLQVPIIHINNKYLNRNKQNQDISNSQATPQLKSPEMIKRQLEEMKNILLKGFKNSEASIIPEGRKK